MAFETKLITANSSWQEISNASFTSVTIYGDQSFSTKTGGVLHIGESAPASNTNDYILLNKQSLPFKLDSLANTDKVFIRSNSGSDITYRIVRN